MYKYKPLLNIIVVLTLLQFIYLLDGPFSHIYVREKSTKKHKRVFDLFMYNGESGLLYTRLWRLNSFVDHFILSMSPRTFSGLPNNISFAPFEKEIKMYSHKLTIINETVECPPGTLERSEAWCLERTQRNNMLKALKKLNPRKGDLVFVSDVDEIPTRKGMEYIISHPPKEFYMLRGLYMTPNFKFSSELWTMAFVLKYRENKEYDFHQQRSSDQNLYPNFPVLTHCSYCFNTIDAYRRKIKSFSHQEFNQHPWINDSFIFRMHYCRHMLLHPEPSNRDYSFEDELLVPNDSRLSYLVDENFSLDITKTIFKKEDLKTLCNTENDWFVNTSFPPVLKPKFYLPGEPWSFTEM